MARIMLHSITGEAFSVRPDQIKDYGSKAESYVTIDVGGKMTKVLIQETERDVSLLLRLHKMLGAMEGR